YIAFLDADDWYLSNRFKLDREVFNQYADADGVYGGTGFYFQESGVLDPDKLTTFQNELAPEQVALSLLRGKEGYFHTNAITLKKVLFHKTGYFDENLILHQDTHLWILCAIQGKLYPGEINNATAV